MFGLGKRKRDALEKDLEELDRTNDDLLDAFDDMLAYRAPAQDASVELSAITAKLPSFDGLAFLAVARETYLRMREAWEHRDSSTADGLATPEVMADLQKTIAADIAAGRRHLLPGVEIRSAAITEAKLDANVATLVVRLHITSREHYVGSDGRIVIGDDSYYDWDEDWTFTRDLASDESAEDRQHALLPEDRGGWDFAHQGWNVSAIARIGGPALAA